MVEKIQVAVIGAGLGGICSGVKLKEAGIEDFLIFDKNPKVGGVWHENNYPGCACDVPIALYSLSFAPSINWSHLYPRSPEIQAYVEEVAGTFQLTPHLRLSQGATKAEWNEAERHWTITTESGDVYEAQSVVAALGQLNRPAWPDIKGRDTFAGPSIHSARWDSSVDLKGKRVGVIGAAASAVQLIPEVAKEASHLTVFQRTPNWVTPRGDREISAEEKNLLMTQPEAAMRVGAANRQIVYENADYFFWQVFEWTKEGREAYTRIALNMLEEQVPDPELRAKLTPDYPIGCKRILITDEFYPAMMRDNVSLVTEGISEIKPKGVVTADGEHHEFDVLIYATGFETTGWKWSMDVIGRGGAHLNDVWTDAPEAYLGITVNDFPNLFVLYGPNTNLGHNSIIFMLEQQVGYTVAALQAMKDKQAQAMVPTKEAQQRFNAELQEQLGTTVWADPNCNSWYKNAEGKITQNWGSHTRGYAEATSKVDVDDYEFLT
ncbi:MAG: cation diffusion facilitator CzcD-associated flavoprotein CzcO [Parvibaculaceae bacterium]|jgi:cation diffusion facilitator CzcD-associated flavoprotein CzcO